MPRVRTLTDDERRARRAESARRYNSKPEVKARVAARKRQRRAADAEFAEASRASNRRWHAANSTRQSEYSKQWRASNPGYSLTRNHGAQIVEWIAAVQSQQAGCCYLCGDPISGKQCVDHDHACCPDRQSCAACRRGIACDRCNMLIGLADDDPERLRRIADHLERASAEARERIARKPVQGTLIDT